MSEGDYQDLKRTVANYAYTDGQGFAFRILKDLERCGAISMAQAKELGEIIQKQRKREAS